jgi:hypothetical protein
MAAVPRAATMEPTKTARQAVATALSAGRRNANPIAWRCRARCRTTAMTAIRAPTTKWSGARNCAVPSARTCRSRNHSAATAAVQSGQRLAWIPIASRFVVMVWSARLSSAIQPFEVRVRATPRATASRTDAPAVCSWAQVAMHAASLSPFGARGAATSAVPLVQTSAQTPTASRGAVTVWSVQAKNAIQTRPSAITGAVRRRRPTARCLQAIRVCEACWLAIRNSAALDARLRPVKRGRLMRAVPAARRQTTIPTVALSVAMVWSKTARPVTPGSESFVFTTPRLSTWLAQRRSVRGAGLMGVIAICGR